MSTTEYEKLLESLIETGDIPGRRPILRERILSLESYPYCIKYKGQYVRDRYHNVTWNSLSQAIKVYKEFCHLICKRIEGDLLSPEDFNTCWEHTCNTLLQKEIVTITQII